MSILHPYTHQWIVYFNNLKTELLKVLSNLSCEIEHVGSTAIPNLDSKPIIDIDIIFYNVMDFEIIKKNLESIGYYHNGNQGIEGREVFKRTGNYQNITLDNIRHHLYVCPSNSKALERHILMRNYLREHEWAKNHYQQLKHELAAKSNHDKKKYAALKELYTNEFIDLIIEKARNT